MGCRITPKGGVELAEAELTKAELTKAELTKAADQGSRPRQLTKAELTKAAALDSEREVIL